MFPDGVGLLRANLKDTTDDRRHDELAPLIEKSADAELLREMIGFAAEKLMALQVGTRTGAGYGEKNGFRLAQRNGYRDQDWENRAEFSTVGSGVRLGSLSIVPKKRKYELRR